MRNKHISALNPNPRQLFLDWYHSTALGKTLGEGESFYLLNNIQHTYYQQILQVGWLGIESYYITDEFQRNFALLTEDMQGVANCRNLIITDNQEWPIASESIDVLILPHLIEFETDPYRVLVEAGRALKPGGRLYILGFNPWRHHGFLGNRQHSPASWNARFLRCHQLFDWLNLLKFEPELGAGFGFPSYKSVDHLSSALLKSLALLCPVYAVKAIKRSWTLTPIKSPWSQTPDFLPGQVLVPPLMRESND